MNQIQPFNEILQSDPEAWALRINARWRQSVENIIEAGQLLIDAKAALVHGQFETMVQNLLDFSPSVAQRLMSVARDNRLTNPAHAQLLPRSWTTLYELTKLSDEEFATGLDKGIIGPDMERADVALLRARPQESQAKEPEADATDLQCGDGAEGLSRHVAGRTATTTSENLDVTAGETGPHSDSLGLYGKSSAIALIDAETYVPMPSGGLAIAHRRDESDDDPREFFPTPPWATRALIEHVLRHLNREGHCKFQNAWEPACGEGHMAEVLREYFRDVAASDAYDYEYRGDSADIFKYDFLTGAHASAENFDWIITNPPFRKSTDFVLKAIALARTGVAMFVRLSWIEGVTRYEKLLRDNPPSLLSIFTERAPLHKARWEPDGSTFTAYAWLVWVKGMPPQPPFWIPPGCRVALSKPEDIKKFGKAIVEGEAA